MAHKIVLNGKFLTAAPTGVHRVAEELILAVDQILQHDANARERYDIELFAPRDIKRRLDLKHIRTTVGGFFTWIPWEQFDLPAHAGKRTIVSLCNLGPVLASNAVTMIHDAQVHISPASYSKPFRLWYKFIQPLIGRRHRRILTVSSYSKQQLVAAGIAPEEKIAVVHNGVDHMMRRKPDPGVATRLNLRPRSYVVGLANCQRHKNIKVLLQAFGDLRLADISLVLFGKADRDSLADEAGGSLSANVITAGAVSDGELAALYADALCIAFPSLTEGFGLPPLEAMTLNCPAIVAPCGSLPEVCGAAALYAGPGSPGEWVARILELAADPAAQRKWALLGRRQSEGFTWAAAASQLLFVLDRMVCVAPADAPVATVSPKVVREAAHHMSE